MNVFEDIKKTKEYDITKMRIDNIDDQWFSEIGNGREIGTHPLHRTAFRFEHYISSELKDVFEWLLAGKVSASNAIIIIYNLSRKKRWEKIADDFLCNICKGTDLETFATNLSVLHLFVK